jgi:hypothetical protein
MRLFVITTAAVGFTMSTLMFATGALAVQDTPMNVNGVETVCTGVGSAKDDPRWAAYPVKIVLATTGGANLASAHVSIAKGGKDVAGLDCDAPWVLFKPGAGAYTATATLIGGSGMSRTVNFTAPASGQKEVTITFPVPSGPPSVASNDTSPVPANAAPRVMVPTPAQ